MASERRASGAGLAAYVPLFSLSVLGAVHEVVRQTDAYLGPGLTLPRSFSLVVLLAGLAVGVWLGGRMLLRTNARAALFVRVTALLSVSCSCAGALWFWAFQSPRVLAVTGILLPACTGMLAGAALAALFLGLGFAYRELGSLGLALAPLPLLAVLSLSLLGAVGLSHAGLWRAAAGFGLLLGSLALSAGRFTAYFAEQHAPSARHGGIAIGLSLLSIGSAQAFVPAALVVQYPAEVVWTDRDAELVVTSGQNNFQLFEEQQLRLTSADAYRYAELAIHPALSALPGAQRVLLFGPAGGFLEREILRYDGVKELVSIAPLEASRFRSSAWPAAEVAPGVDGRLRFVSAEPLVWLEQPGAAFDAIFVHLPAPVGYEHGKYYTRYFYELLARRLTAGGALTVQTAPRASLPRTFATIQRTLESVGWRCHAYEAPVPLQGALSFVVATRGPSFRFDARRLPAGLRFLDAAAIERSALLGAAAASVDAPISTLDRQYVVDTWHDERALLGD